MGKCIGNCIKCDLVPDEDKMFCCSFQTLRQNIEIRTQLNAMMAKLESLSVVPELPKSIVDVSDAEPPAASQES